MTRAQEPGLPTLYTEHLVLGATFDEDGRVSGYSAEVDIELAREASAGAYVADISNITALLFSGADAVPFAEAAFAGKKLEVGECSFEAVLTGDGGVASVPLLARTGTSEYVAFDITPRSAVLEAWLSFLSNVNQNGYAPYEHMETEDVTGSHVVLAMWGPAAHHVLSDYTHTDALPKTGEIRSCTLDNIACIVTCIPLGDASCYMLLVPPRQCVALWRSFLSFTEVEPVGTLALEALLAVRLPWFLNLQSTDTLRMPARNLRDAGILRTMPDFVGARGIQAMAEGE